MTKTILNWIRHVYWEASFTLFYLPSVVSADSQSLDDWPINQSDKLVWATCIRLHPDKISHSLEGVEKLKARWWLVVQQVLVIHKPIRRIRNIGQLMIWHVYIKHLQGEHTAVSNNNILTGTVNQWLPGKKSNCLAQSITKQSKQFMLEHEVPQTGIDGWRREPWKIGWELICLSFL